LQFFLWINVTVILWEIQLMREKISRNKQNFFFRNPATPFTSASFNFSSYYRRTGRHQWTLLLSILKRFYYLILELPMPVWSLIYNVLILDFILWCIFPLNLYLFPLQYYHFAAGLMFVSFGILLLLVAVQVILYVLIHFLFYSFYFTIY
jgi:hypothetical protein